MRISQRSVSWRTYGFAFAIALSPALMQTEPTCAQEGDTTLSRFEFEVLGVNHIDFDSSQRVYWPWLPSVADTAVVRAYSTDPDAEVTYEYRDPAGALLDAGWFTSFNGGGEMTLDGLLPQGESVLRVFVKTPGTAAARNYTAVIHVGCSDCDDGDACTRDACDPFVDACAHPLESGCSPAASALLLSFEVEVLGQNQISFDVGDQDYSVWLPAIADTAIVRATAMHAYAEVTFEYRNAVGDLLELRSLGRGGEITLDGLVPPEQSILRVWVEDPDGTLRLYTVDMYVGCANCDDGNQCTSDACDPALERCVHTAEPAGTACDAAGIPGLCVGLDCRAFCSATSCDDGNLCTVDDCDPQLGVCEHTVLVDGSACGPGVCYAGACSCAQGCDDGNDCTDDACDVPADLCIHTPVADGTLCSGDLGICHAGNCACAQGCDDGNDCTIDTCNAAADQCEHTPTTDGTACPGGGSCEAGSCVGGTFACTEQGILEAIAAGGGPHAFDCDGPTTLVTTDTIVIDNDVILDGAGELTIDGDVRAFEIPSGVTAELHGWNVAGDACESCGRGGCFCWAEGISNSGTLALESSRVSDRAVGITNGGTLTITNSTVSGHASQGIQGYGPVTVAHSTVSGNAGNGLSLSGPGAVIITNSTVSGNGMGIYSVSGASVTLENSTVTGHDFDGIVSVGAGTITVANSIVDGSCVIGVGSSLGFNIESPGNTCGFGEASDQVDVSAEALALGLLQNNGGPTATHVLLPGSVAIDWILPGSCALTTDQRGVTRPQGGACDVGAFEYADCTGFSCDDGNVCTNDNCDPLSGDPWCINSVVPDLVVCDFGGLAGVCAAGACIEDHCAGVAPCDDGNDCTDDSCDPLADPWCSNTPVSDGTACDFGGLAGLCAGGQCVAQTWGTAELVGPGEFHPPKAAVDPNGNITAVWARSDALGFNILSSQYSPGIGWSAAELIETEDGASSPTVVVDSNGDATAVWCLSGDLWFNRYSPSTGWGAAELVDAGCTEPTAVVDPGGIVTVVRTTYVSVTSSRYTPGVGWGASEVITSVSGQTNGAAALAVDPNGRVTAVWAQSPYSGSTTDYVLSNHFLPGAGWGIAETIAPNTGGPAFMGDVAADLDGNAVAVWSQNWGTRSILANRYAMGVGWGNAQPIETDDSGYASAPRVTVHPSGHATAVWVHSDGVRDSVWSNRYTPGTGWGSVELVETDDAGDASAPRVAVDLNGQVTAVWVQSIGFLGNIWSNRYTPGTGWGTPEPIEVNPDSAEKPHLVVDANGDVTALWLQSGGVWANRFEQ